MKNRTFYYGTVFGFLFVLIVGGAVFAVEEPTGLQGTSYSTMGTTQSIGSCDWYTIMDREGSDGGHLIIELDGCHIWSYELFTMEQDSQAGVLAELKEGDFFIVWDEDAGHGGNTHFTYTNNAYAEDVGNPYIRVSRPAEDNVTNWKVYRTTAPGTLTITSTGENEHEAIRANLNIMQFEKYDDVDDEECVSPGITFTYTICFNNLNGIPLEDAYVIDRLPVGVTYPESEYTIGYDPNAEPPITLNPPDPGYIESEHAYVWLLGDIDPNDADCLELSVVVNEAAIPGGYLHNVAELWYVADIGGVPTEILGAVGYVDTWVCCYDVQDGILYVDQSATDGLNSGVSWQNAYTDLQDALFRARTTECQTDYVIYVAEGTYSPGDDEADTYEVPNGVYVYGGFKTGGCAFEERNPKRYKTVLTGRIDETTRNDTIVTMGQETLLDGFTVTEAAEYGIYGDGADFVVEACRIHKSDNYGLRAANGNVTVRWSNITANKYDGIRHEGQGYVLQVENCWIRQSGRYGIFL